MSEPILKTVDLSRHFNGTVAVDALSLAIRPGEIFSLLGPNGAGKTTTIAMLSCLITPTAGDAYINGRSVTREATRVKGDIGVVPQEIALYDALTGRQNLQFWGRMYGLGGRALNERIDETLAQVGLAERAGDPVENYSGGMQRRLNIAAGLLHRPQLLFMDEPTVGIDPQSRRNILEMVKGFRDEGMTILYTTHYMEEAQELSDRVGIIDHGRLIAVGTQAELTGLVGEQETLRLHVDPGQASEAAADELARLPAVLTATAAGDELVLTVREAGPALAPVVGHALAQGLHINSIDIDEPNLEGVFLHLTGRALRD